METSARRVSHSVRSITAFSLPVTVKVKKVRNEDHEHILWRSKSVTEVREFRVACISNIYHAWHSQIIYDRSRDSGRQVSFRGLAVSLIGQSRCGSQLWGSTRGRWFSLDGSQYGSRRWQAGQLDTSVGEG